MEQARGPIRLISILRGPAPEVLVANGELWGQEYAAALEAGLAPPTRYRRDDVRDALRADTFGKCAYCESHMEHVSFAHIEHILPKSVVPLLVCIWTNLTLACERCNVNKGDYHSDAAPLLNPYVDNVETDITFHGPMTIDRSDRAKLTIARLKLNRPELLFRREEKLRQVLRVLDLMLEHNANAAIRGALAEDLQALLSREAEYANCARRFEADEGPARGVAPAQ